MGKGPDHGADRFRERARRERDYKDQLPGEDDKPLPDPVAPIQSEAKPDRNQPCSCGSGKKYKKCCGKPD